MNITSNYNKEEIAAKHSSQYIGCVNCKKSHHTLVYCDCGRCFYKGTIHKTNHGTFVECKCGAEHLWD